ncbi:MAG TPA: hypothetical protein VGC54_05400 [Planctomycetota bacterium]
MHRRQASVLAVALIGIALATFVVLHEGGSQPAEEPPLIAAAASTDELAGASAQPVGAETPHGRELLASTPMGSLRVQVKLPAGASFSFTGKAVRAWTLDPRTRVVTERSASLDAQGRADFGLEAGQVVQALRFDPPPQSGMGIAIASPRARVLARTRLDLELVLEPATPWRGHVRTLEDYAVADAAIRVFDAATVELTTSLPFQSGLAQTRTADDGSFEFTSLPPGAWRAAVVPDAWLQLVPPLDREAPPGSDGILRVERAHPIQVQVVDGAGLPVAGIELALSPLEFQSPSLRTERVARGDAPTSLLWPYDPFRRTTDAGGRAEFRTVEGRWRIAASRDGDFKHPDALVTMETEVPAPPRILRWP